MPMAQRLSSSFVLLGAAVSLDAWQLVAGAGTRGMAAQQACYQERDCSISAWCTAAGYDAWCLSRAADCPAPWCTRTASSGGAASTSSTRAPTTATTTVAATTGTRSASTTSTLRTATPAAATTAAATTAAATTTRSPSTTTSVPATRTTTLATTTKATTTRAASTSAVATTTTRAASTSAVATTTGASTSGCPGAPSSPIGAWFKEADFQNFFPNINNVACTGATFFTRCALLEAAAAFPSFCNSGNSQLDKLELAAFLGQTSHETTGGWATAPGGPQAWGYCFKEEVGCQSGSCTGYCAAGNPCSGMGYDCTCVAGQTYHGRGPVQLSWNYNYALFSKSLLGDASILLKDPSQLTRDPVMSFKSAIWFWMTAQSPKPSCHDVMTGAWTPTAADTAAGRVAGYGMVTNVINGGLECNQPTDSRVTDRVEYFKRYLGLLGVAVPDATTLYCDKMRSY